MDTLNTQIGALELNTAAILADGALERAALSANPMTMNHHPMCHHIDAQGIEDSALEEAAGLQMGPQTMRRLQNTLCVG